MVERKIYFCKIKPGKQLEAADYFIEMKDKIKNAESLLTCSMFEYEDIIILYYESFRETIQPEQLFKKADFLERCPVSGHSVFLLMETIFYYNKPVDEKHWARKSTAKPVGTLGKIKPGMLSSYIYHHHILQETVNKERDKYGIISVFNNYLFYYKELPSVQEYPSFPGKINGIIPADWQEIMTPHFILWDDTQKPWKEMKSLI